MNKKLSLSELNRVSPGDYKSLPKHPVVVVLDNIRSMHNVGALFRTADALALERLILTGFTPQPPHRDIHKSALGATETVDWQYEADTLSAVSSLKADGYLICAIEQAEHTCLLQDFRVPMDQKICLVLGNEVTGVQQPVIDLADVCLEIPQFGTKHSFNVSVCGGIVAWEVVKQLLRGA